MATLGLRRSILIGGSFLALGSFLNSKIECDFKDSGLKLLGTGIRRVTIFQFDAYNLSLFISNADIERITRKKRWIQEFDKSKLQTPDKEFFIKDLLESDLVLEIKPTRVTGGGHLVNGIAKFLNQKYKDYALNPVEAKEFKNMLTLLKNSFPKLQIIKDASILFKKRDDELQILLNGHEIVKIDNKYLTRWFFEAYLGQIAPDFVQDVGRGLESLILNT